MKFTVEDIKRLDKVADEMRKTVYNHSTSFLSIELRGLISEMYPKLGYGGVCLTCPSGIAQALGNIYSNYIADKAEYAKAKENNKIEEQPKQCTSAKRKTKK